MVDVDLGQEQALIRAAQKGDETAVSQLYDAFVDKIFRYLFYRLDSRETAEDLTSEVFLRFVEGLPSFEMRDVPLRAWLYQIAHARLVDHYRRNSQARPSLEIESLEITVEDHPDEALMSSFNQQQLHDALKELKETYRDVIVLRFIEGESLQSTARILGKTVGAVKVMQHRALRLLSQILAKQGLGAE